MGLFFTCLPQIWIQISPQEFTKCPYRSSSRGKKSAVSLEYIKNQYSSLSLWYRIRIWFVISAVAHLFTRSVRRPGESPLKVPRIFHMAIKVYLQHSIFSVEDFFTYARDGHLLILGYLYEGFEPKRLLSDTNRPHHSSAMPTKKFGAFQKPR